MIRFDRARTRILLLVGVLCISLVVIARAQEQPGKELTPQEKERLMQRQARETLDGTVWKITLKEITTAEKKKTMEDTLNFQGRRVESEMLVKEGFSASNYSVRIKDEDRIIWETMQTGEEKGLAFWRGELKKDVSPCVMRGVLSWHIEEGKKIDYSFASEEQEQPFELGVPRKKALTPKPQPTPEPEEEEVTESEEAQEEPEKEAAPAEEEQALPQRGPQVEEQQEPPQVQEEAAAECKEEKKEEQKRFFWQR